MNWSEHQNGYLAKTEKAFFFVYEQFSLWDIDYETGAATYGDGEGMPVTLHGFRTLDAAKVAAEIYARRLAVNPIPRSLEEE